MDLARFDHGIASAAASAQEGPAGGSPFKTLPDLAALRENRRCNRIFSERIQPFRKRPNGDHSPHLEKTGSLLSSFRLLGPGVSAIRFGALVDEIGRKLQRHRGLPRARLAGIFYVRH